MQNKAFFTAFLISASIHGALLLPIFPVISGFPIKDGSNYTSISMGSIIIGRGKAEKKNAEVKPQRVRDRADEQYPEVVAAIENALGRSGEDEDNKGKVKNQYFAEIRERIEKVKQYPDFARERGFEGISEIAFVILADGKIQKIELINSSGYQALNNAAIDTIKKASPFSAIPEELGESQIKITIPLVFELKGGDDRSG